MHSKQLIVTFAWEPVGVTTETAILIVMELNLSGTFEPIIWLANQLFIV